VKKEKQLKYVGTAPEIVGDDDNCHECR